MKSSLVNSTLNGNESRSSANAISKTEGIAFFVSFAMACVLIVVGNLLTIVLFAAKRRLRKRSLYLVVNMASADFMLGVVSLPIYMYLVGGSFRLWRKEWSKPSETLYRFVDDFFMQASIIFATMISGERFYATYRPFKHRTLSQRAYGVVIVIAWILALSVSAILSVLQSYVSDRGFLYFWLPYTLILTCIICGCNIAIWKKFQQGRIASQQQNRASQSRRLTKTLLFVSLIALLSWLPLIIMNVLIFFRPSIRSQRFYYLANVLNYSNSFVNPIVYALRIPDFKQGLGLHCCRRKATPTSAASNIEECNQAVILSSMKNAAGHKVLALENDPMDTKL